MSSEFVCRLGTPAGRVVREVRRAESAEELRRELTGAGYHVFDLRPRGLARLWPRLSGERDSRRVPQRRFVIFNQELAALLKAGLPLLGALDMMLERVEEPTLRRVLRAIRNRVESGEDLSDAVAAQRDVFPPLYAATLKAGERTGELEGVLRRFLRYQRLLTESRRRIVGALLYPAVLTGLSIGLIAVMTIFVIPRFQGFYTAMGAEQLPFMTRVTMGLAGWLERFWPVLALVLAVAGVAAWRWVKTARGRLIADRFVLRLPWLGGVFRRFALGEFSRSLATLLAGGLPLPSALDIAVGAVGNRHVRSRLEPVPERVREGSSFHEALEESGVFDPLAAGMVRVGEATGGLSEMLSEVADFFDQELETRLERILNLVEPLLLVVMGVLIALLLVSVYMPLFSVLQQMRI